MATAAASNSFKLMRCEHLKKRADELHAQQRYREAADAYARAIDAARAGAGADRYLDVHLAVRLHGNRSLSLVKCASDEALRDGVRDALTCVRLAPEWTKGAAAGAPRAGAHSTAAALTAARARPVPAPQGTGGWPRRSASSGGTSPRFARSARS